MRTSQLYLRDCLNTLVLACGVVCALLPSAAAVALDDTWSATPNDANWVPASETTNWNGGIDLFPGDITGTTVTNPDLATFNSASAQTAITVNDAALNLRGITFDTSAAAYTIGSTGGNSLLLSSGGTIQVLSTFLGTALTESINAPLVLEPATSTTAGTYAFTNSSADNTNSLAFGGAISGGTTTAGITLTLSGSNTSTANVISGDITAGNAAGGIAITKSGAGRWTLSGTNTNANLRGALQGTLILDAGQLTGESTLAIGSSAAGTLTLNNSAQLATTASTDLKLATTAGNNGTLNLNNSSVVTVNRDLLIGTNTAQTTTTGRVNVNDSATLNVTRNLNVGLIAGGQNARTAGRLDVNGGTVTVGGTLTVTMSGDNNTGTGILNVIGGSVTCNQLTVANTRQKANNVSVNINTAGTLQATNGVVFSVAQNGTANTTSTLTMNAGGF